jgi:hypothetical protein
MQEPHMTDSAIRHASLKRMLIERRRGQRAIQGWVPAESVSISATASPMLNATISEGTNQKLPRRLLQTCFSLFMAC